MSFATISRTHSSGTVAADASSSEFDVSTSCESALCQATDDIEPIYHQPFARSDFPLPIERASIPGISSGIVLRVCFRIGEALRAAAICKASQQIALIELFAQVTNTYRTPGTTKQHFQFCDLFHDRPPFLNGVLANYKGSEGQQAQCDNLLEACRSSEAQRAEFDALLEVPQVQRMTRCLCRLERSSNNTSWLAHILNIRSTDWKEVEYVKTTV